MNITREADYAIRVIGHLSAADEGEVISASTMAEREKVPSQFLLKILRKLRKADLIKSYMGVNGGYRLKHDPEDISLRDVIEAIDGPIFLNRCLYHPKECNKNFAHSCPVRVHLAQIENSLLTSLDEVDFKTIIGG